MRPRGVHLEAHQHQRTTPHHQELPLVHLVRAVPHSFRGQRRRWQKANRQRSLHIWHGKIILVLAKSGQEQIAATTHGSLQLAVERISNNHIWRMEWILGVIWCHFYWPQKGNRQANFQYTKYNTWRGTHEIVPYFFSDRESDVCIRWGWWQILAQRSTYLWFS
jgi:hypothetical protein